MKKINTIEKYKFDSYEEIANNADEFEFFINNPTTGEEKSISIVDEEHLEDNPYTPEDKSECGLYVEKYYYGCFYFHPLENYDLENIYGIKEINQ